MSSPNLCEYTYGISGCEGSREYKILYIISIVMWSISCIFPFSLFYWKLRYRKNSKLFSNKLFSPVEGFLLFCGISSLTRIIHYIVIIFDLCSGYPIIRELISTFSWSPGFMGVYSFIAGMFQSILRMKFEQFTTSPTNRISENIMIGNSDGRNRSTTVWIPRGHQVIVPYWTLIFLLFTSTTTFSVIMGLNREKTPNNGFMRPNKLFLLANGLLYGTFWVNCVLVVSILMYHGRSLVRMSKESFALSGIQDASNSNVSERIKKRLENAKVTFTAYINKMRTFNYCIMIMMLWFSICLIPLAVVYERLFVALWNGLLFSTISNLITPVCNYAVLVGILKAELNPNQDAATAVAVIELNEMNSYFSEVDSSEA